MGLSPDFQPEFSKSHGDYSSRGWFNSSVTIELCGDGKRKTLYPGKNPGGRFSTIVGSKACRFFALERCNSRESEDRAVQRVGI
ncbi:MAG: hypothetical protein ACU843_06550 [Gammaproteobacteria bacterium]